MSDSLPVFDAGDLALVGWESGLADDGDFVIQVRCHHDDCEVAHAIKLAPGASIAHDPPGTMTSRHVEFHGPMKTADRIEP